jgi:hypothetical protein
MTTSRRRWGDRYGVRIRGDIEVDLTDTSRGEIGRVVVRLLLLTDVPIGAELRGRDECRGDRRGRCRMGSRSI